MPTLLQHFRFRREQTEIQRRNDAQAPRVGDLAPEFELVGAADGVLVRLSSFRGDRPVALVFGSFT